MPAVSGEYCTIPNGTVAPPRGYDGPPLFVANPVDHVVTLIGTGTGAITVITTARVATSAIGAVRDRIPV
ncbi:hypothetical protein MAHJHV28_45440 [Mycobacterium avium subsp. hominissuis]